MHEFPQSSKSIEHILCRESIVELEQLAARHARPDALQILLAVVHAPQYSDRWQVFLPHLPLGGRPAVRTGLALTQGGQRAG